MTWLDGVIRVARLTTECGAPDYRWRHTPTQGIRTLTPGSQRPTAVSPTPPRAAAQSSSEADR